MSVGLLPITEKQTLCKCCGSVATLYGLVDFHKNCESYRRKVLDLSGIPIYYFRCPACHFIFTTAFDHFTSEDLCRYIYNDEYLVVDPDYQQIRPKDNAAKICKLFPDLKSQRILDYGGGQGFLAELLRSIGHIQVDTYDPMVPRHAARPQQRYSCILCFEVVEHSTDPARTFAEINDLLAEPGLVLFTTMFQPADIDQHGLNWWYAGPRNGHVSLFSQASMLKLLQPFGFVLGSFNDSWHVIFRTVPDFAKHIIKTG